MSKYETDGQIYYEHVKSVLNSVKHLLNVSELRQSRQEFLEETRGRHPGMTPADLSPPSVVTDPHPRPRWS